MKRKLKVRFGIVLALMSAFLYAFNFIIEKKFIEYSDSFSILFLMYLGGGLGLLTIHLINRRKKDLKNDTKNRLSKKRCLLFYLL